MRIGLIHGFDKGYFHTHYAKVILDEVQKAGNEAVDISVNNLALLQTVEAAYVMPYGLRVDFERLYPSIPIINSKNSQTISMRKIETSEILIKKGIPTPATVVSNDFSDISDLVDEMGTSILKFPMGCAGYGHFIIYKNNDIIAVTKYGRFKVEKHSDHLSIGNEVVPPPYYAQEFISFSGDAMSNDRVYRMYIVGDRVPMGTLRIKDKIKGPEDSIINIAQGAHYQLIKPAKPMTSTALQVVDAVGFDIGVVDILADSKGNHYVIECDCDGRYSVIDRKFKELADYCSDFNFDKMIAERLAEIGQGKPYRREMKTKPMYVTIDPALPLKEGNLILLKKKIDEAFLTRTFNELLRRVLDPKADEYNPAYNTSDRNLATLIQGWFREMNENPSVTVRTELVTNDNPPEVFSFGLQEIVGDYCNRVLRQKKRETDEIDSVREIGLILTKCVV